MSVYAVWESHFPAQDAEQGRQLTEAIWRDTLAFDGYESHQVIEDLDDPGHLLVVGKWATRGAADAALREYRDNPNAVRVSELVSRPRERFVGA